VAEAGEEPDLPGESVSPYRHGQLRPKHLDRHEAAARGLLRQIDPGHPPPPDLTIDSVQSADGFPERDQLIHW